MGGGGACLGALRMTLPVVALGKSEVHSTVVRQHLQQHLANELCSHSPLADPDLVARAALLTASKRLCRTDTASLLPCYDSKRGSFCHMGLPWMPRVWIIFALAHRLACHQVEEAEVFLISVFHCRARGPSIGYRGEGEKQDAQKDTCFLIIFSFVVVLLQGMLQVGQILRGLEYIAT